MVSVKRLYFVKCCKESLGVTCEDVPSHKAAFLPLTYILGQADSFVRLSGVLGFNSQRYLRNMEFLHFAVKVLRSDVCISEFQNKYTIYLSY